MSKLKEFGAMALADAHNDKIIILGLLILGLALLVLNFLGLIQ